MSGKIKPKHHPINAQLEYDFIPGPVRIKDGLFIGDELAAKDVEFIITNKISHIINTVSRRIPNMWEKIGVQYISFNWSENEQNVLDKKNITINLIFNFIEESIEEGKSCLVHSVNAKSRAFVVVAAYLMKKYNWTLEKTRDFISLKKDNLDVRSSFMEQLKELEQRLGKLSIMSNHWEEAQDEDELVLLNTYKNTKVIPYSNASNGGAKSKKKVGWLDNDTKNTNKYVEDKKGALFRDTIPEKASKSKSILKGSAADNKTQLRPQEPQVQPTVTANTNHKDHNLQHPNGQMPYNEVPVNNYISPKESRTSIKKPANNPLMSRPFSSDAKERDKKKQLVRDSKKITYDPVMAGFKSPYEAKIINTRLGRGARQTVNGSIKKDDEIYKPASTFYQRAQSASNTDKKKIKATENTGRDELVVMNYKPSKLGASIGPSQNFSNSIQSKWRGF